MERLGAQSRSRWRWLHDAQHWGSNRRLRPSHHSRQIFGDAQISVERRASQTPHVGKLDFGVAFPAMARRVSAVERGHGKPWRDHLSIGMPTMPCFACGHAQYSQSFAYVADQHQRSADRPETSRQFQQIHDKLAPTSGPPHTPESTQDLDDLPAYRLSRFNYRLHHRWGVERRGPQGYSS